MKAGVIGAGRIGGGLARQLAGAGHQVLLSFRRDQAEPDRLAAQIGGGASTGSPADAVMFGEVVVISVPWSALPLALGQAGAVYGEEYRLPDAMAVVGALRAGRPIPPAPQY